jgi:hypothetical protein
MDKEEEEHKDLEGAIDPKKLIACSASLCRICLSIQSKGISRDLSAL